MQRNDARPTARATAGVAALGLVVLTVGIGVSAAVLRPDITRRSQFLFADQGVNLLVAQRMLDGAQLFSEIGYQYGIFAAHGYALFASVFGNGVYSYLGYHVTFSAINILLAFALLRTVVSIGTATLVAAAALVPMLATPGAVVGAWTSAAYIPMERTALLLTALIWVPPAERERGRALALGVVLGLMQGIRFGTAVFAGVCVTLVDALALWRGGASRQDVARWIRSMLVTGAAFLLVEACFLLYAFGVLPRDVAIDFAWPLYTLDSFVTFRGARWPAFSDMRYTLTHYITPIIGALAGVVLVGLSLRRGRASGSRQWPPAGPTSGDLRLLVPFAFFALGALNFFKQPYHFEQFAWTLAFPLAWFAREYGSRARVILLALCTPVLAFMVRSVFMTAPQGVPLELPNGERLMVEPDVPERVEAIVGLVDAMRREAAAEGRDASPVVIAPTASGLHVLYDVPFAVRQPWHLPGFIRPRDARELIDLTERRGLTFVVLPQIYERTASFDPQAQLPDDPCAWADYSPYPASLCAELDRRLGTPVRIAANTWVIRPVPPDIRTAPSR